MNVLFVETSYFTTHVTEYLTDDEYRRFQWFLLENPHAGAVIGGTGESGKSAGRWPDVENVAGFG